MARVFFPGVVLLLAGACAASQPVETTPEPASQVEPLPPLNEARLASLRERLPELATHVERLRERARREAEAGHHAIAVDLIGLAEVTMLTVDLALAIEDSGPELDVAVADPEPLAAMDTGGLDGDIVLGEDTPRVIRERRPRPRPTRNEDPAETDGEVLETDAPASETAIRQRLAAVAVALGEQEIGEPRESEIQALLLEADRALAEGILERAGELTSAAEAALNGERVEPSSSEDALIRDATERLGPNAVRSGDSLFVPLQRFLRYSGEHWSVRDAGILDALRSIVRGYRDRRLSLVHVGGESTPYRTQEAELIAYLCEHFQIETSRLRVDGSGVRGMPAGSYLVFRGDSR